MWDYPSDEALFNYAELEAHLVRRMFWAQVFPRGARTSSPLARASLVGFTDEPVELDGPRVRLWRMAHLAGAYGADPHQVLSAALYEHKTAPPRRALRTCTGRFFQTTRNFPPPHNIPIRSNR